MPRPQESKRPPSYADLEALPEHLVGEILAGELVVSPRPAPRHGRASSVLGGGIGGPFDWGPDGPGGWWILDEPELHLGDDVVIPDLAGWRRENMPALPAEVAWFMQAPDWVCEVPSPSTRGIDRIRKMPIYAWEGVGHAWILEPEYHTLEVLRLERGRWVIVGTHEGDVAVRAEPFEAVELDLTPLWITSAAPEPTGE